MKLSKRTIIAAIAGLAVSFLVMGLIINNAHAGPWCRKSETKTADATITTSKGVFHGIIVMTDATNAVTVDIYDNASAASGTKLIPTWTVTTSATDRAQTLSISPPVRFYNGMYVDITCAGTVSYMMYFENN